MKKIEFLGVCAALVFLAACGGSNDVSDGDKTVISEPAPEDSVETSAAFSALPEPYRSADFDKGARLFRGQCSGCHTLGQGDIAIVGPNLFGMFERTVGGLDSYSYSAALEEADFQWTPDALDSWLADPAGYMPGNRMPMSGLTRSEDRTALIAYILSETKD